ncbi:hypothetical protein NQD34_000096 [Periophthalmus magnuspinnatus]|nr:hypothetical protein NQD34_000096 [Periophthalmus magnuspinnatus]
MLSQLEFSEISNSAELLHALFQQPSHTQSARAEVCPYLCDSVSLFVFLNLLLSKPNSEHLTRPRPEPGSNRGLSADPSVAEIKQPHSAALTPNPANIITTCEPLFQTYM